mgnify:CR=1 FL=1
MRTKKTGILAGIMTACICVAQSVPAFGAQQDLVGFEPNTGSQAETQVKSYLTGENVPESIGRRRPVCRYDGQQQFRCAAEWDQSCRSCV